MTAGVEGLPTGARDKHDEAADELTRLTEELGLYEPGPLRPRPYDDRQHRSTPDCWCKPVADGIGWRHQ